MTVSYFNRSLQFPKLKMEAAKAVILAWPEDLELTGMNFGWEVPGTFDAGLQIRNLSIRIVE